jgi:hypothetical protein
MKLTPASQEKVHRSYPASRRLALTPRTTYPTVSLVPLRSGVLARLAWIFGFHS